MEYTKEHIKAQLDRIVELEQERGDLQKFIGSLSWELELTSASHSGSQEYIDAIRALQKRAEDAEAAQDELKKDYAQMRASRDEWNTRYHGKVETEPALRDLRAKVVKLEDHMAKCVEGQRRIALVKAIERVVDADIDLEICQYQCPTCGCTESADEFLRREDKPRCNGGCKFENSVMLPLPPFGHEEVNILRTALKTARDSG